MGFAVCRSFLSCCDCDNVIGQGNTTPARACAVTYCHHISSGQFPANQNPAACVFASLTNGTRFCDDAFIARTPRTIHCRCFQHAEMLRRPVASSVMASRPRVGKRCGGTGIVEPPLQGLGHVHRQHRCATREDAEMRNGFRRLAVHLPAVPPLTALHTHRRCHCHPRLPAPG